MGKVNTIMNINFVKVVELLLPGNKRKPIILAWLNALVYPLDYVYQIWRNDYLEGKVYSEWSSLTAYTKGDRVLCKTSSYECLIDNTGIIPETNRTQWIKLNDNFIGLYDRIRYNSQKLSLQLYLNEYYQNTGNPDLIFIENNALKAQSTYLFNLLEADTTYFANEGEVVTFVFGDPYSEGDFVKDGNDIYMCVSNNTSEPTTNEAFWQIYPYLQNEGEIYGDTDFTVYVPLALYTTLGTNDTQRDANVQSQVDKYKPFGTINDIKTY